jgi:hypothetical protein
MSTQNDMFTPIEGIISSLPPQPSPPIQSQRYLTKNNCIQFLKTKIGHAVIITLLITLVLIWYKPSCITYINVKQIVCVDYVKSLAFGLIAGLLYLLAPSILEKINGKV